MSNNPYTLLDAMRDECDFLEELKAWSEKEKKHLLAGMMREQRNSLMRILKRYEQGIEYSLEIRGGEMNIKRTQTNRHLVRDYPAVAAAQENLKTLEKLVGKSND